MAGALLPGRCTQITHPTRRSVDVEWRDGGHGLQEEIYGKCMTFSAVDTLGRLRLTRRRYCYSGVRCGTAPARLSVGVRLTDSDI